jgi:endonuclease/exonuclease/phosphatase family metal-dependent hydrolase
MVSFLFWNLMGNQTATWTNRVAALKRHLARLVRHLEVDVLLLAESRFLPGDLFQALNADDGLNFGFPESNAERVHLFTRLPLESVVDMFHNPADGRLSVRRLILPKTDLLLATVHFQSQMVWRTDEQLTQAIYLQSDIAQAEDDAGHQRTLVVGDLNMNPFDPGMTSAHGLHAVMARDIARDETRTVNGRTFRYFYSPMWGCFGDRSPGPPGTYFYRQSTPICYFWHLFDQVLLRPSLMDALTDLHIVVEDGEESLVTEQGRPRASSASDHLPLYFRLNLYPWRGPWLKHCRISGQTTSRWTF